MNRFSPARFFSTPSRTAGLVFVFLLPLLIWKLSFFLSAQPLTGWDTPGHLYLAQKYRGLWEHFDSLGYDPGWFQGFPIFYFYPPFYYFFVAHLSAGPWTFVTAFNGGMLGAILFFAYAYLKWAALLLAECPPVRRGLLSALGLVFYLSFPGDGLQGTGLVGLLGGTIVSTFAHGFVLYALYLLEEYRRTCRRGWPVGFVLCAALLVYTHYLTTVFFWILLVLYLGVFRREFSLREIILVLILPVFAAWPLVANYYLYRSYLSGTSALPDYPALLSVIGSDFSETLLNNRGYWTALARGIFVDFKWINFLFVGLYLRFLATAVRAEGRTGERSFVLFASLLLLWISLDKSPAFLLFPLSVHWYRVFDLFFGLFTVAAMFALDGLLAKLRDFYRADLVAGSLLLIVLIRFFAWDPVAHEKYESIKLYGSARDPAALETFLRSIEPDSLILPEKLRQRDFFGSPHAFEYFIKKYGHRSLLGLTVESSQGAMLTYAYLARGMPEVFVWGVDQTWREELYAEFPESETLAPYLRRKGLAYVLGRTPRLRAALARDTANFEPAFADRDSFAYRLRDARRDGAVVYPGGALGFLGYDHIRQEALAPERMGRDFLLHANQTRLRLGPGPPMIHLDPYLAEPDFERRLEPLAGLVVFHPGPGLAGSHEVHRFARENRELILVNFEKTAPDPVPTRYLYTLLRLPSDFKPKRKSAGPAPAPPESVRPVFAGSHEIHVQVPATLAPPAKPDASTGRCAPVEIQRDYFPLWRETRGLDVYRTDANFMLVCAPDGRIELKFENTLSRTVTAMMYLLSGGLILNRLLALFTALRSGSGTPVGRTDEK